MGPSVRVRYATRALLDLAEHAGEGVVLARDVAERQKMPARYLEQILPMLRRAGIVSATRGPNGGYALAKGPEAITMAEVAIALDGPFWSEEGGECADCGAGAPCTVHEVWNEAGKAAEERMRGITLAEVMARRREREAQAALMYEI